MLSESPWLYNAPLDRMNSDYENLKRQDILNAGGTYSEPYGNYDVIFLDFNRTHNIYMVDGDSVILHYSWDDLLNNAQTKLAWNSKRYPGLFRKYFIEIILPKLKIIESDDMMTENAFRFWKMIMRDHPSLNFYIKNPDNIVTRLTSPDDIDNYKERMNTTNEYSRFIVSV